jgi:hypothetical protein
MATALAGAATALAGGALGGAWQDIVAVPSANTPTGRRADRIRTLHRTRRTVGKIVWIAAFAATPSTASMTRSPAR